MRRLYLDHNASAPLRPEARLAIVEALSAGWGNPSSVHAAGRAARDAVEKARADVAALLGASAEEIVFTSGGTEADHLAVCGLARAARAAGRGAHVVSSPLEHPAVHGALAALAGEGFAVSLLPVGADGTIAPEAAGEAVREDTALVTLAAANHELGNVYPVAAFAAAARARGALFHADAVQQAGKAVFDVRSTGVDAASVSAHKIGGPAGVGALFVRRGIDLAPLRTGGHQERERRPGTENVVGIVGFGAACRAAVASLAAEAARTARLRDRLERAILAVPGARLHGAPSGRLPGTCNVGFAGARGDLVVIGLDLEGVCVSSGAACSSGSVEPSPVLRALGLSPEAAREGVRVSLGSDLAESEVDEVAALMARVVERVRAARA